MDNCERRIAANCGENTASTRTFEMCLVLTAWVISGTMVILCVMNLSELGTNAISEPSISSNVYETLLLALSLVAIFILFRVRGESTGSRNTQDEHFSNANIFESNWIIVLLGLLACLSLIQPVFELTSIVACISRKAESPEILRFSLRILKCTFLVSQMLFFVLAHGRRCNTAVTSICVMILVSTNICLIVACVSDGAQQAILMNTYNNSETAYSNMFCENQTSALSNGYKVVDNYFQRSMFMFGLYAVELLLVMWNLFPKRERQFQDTTEECADDGETDADWLIAAEQDNCERPSYSSRLLPNRRRRRSLITRLKTAFCLKLCKYSYILTFVVCLAMFIAHVLLNTNLGNYDSSKDTEREHTNEAFILVQTIYENCVSGAAFVGFLLVRREKIMFMKVSFRQTLLVLFACFLFILLTIEMVDSIISKTRFDKVSNLVLFVLRTIFYFVGVIFQTAFILKSADFQQLNLNSDKYVFLRGVLWVMAITNIERGMADVFLKPVMLQHVIGDWIGTSNKNIITRTLFPGVLFYRLQSSLLCIENLHNMKLRRELLGIDSVTI